MKKLFTQVLFAFVLICFLTVPVSAKPGDLVYIVPIKGTIDPGLASFVERVYDEAEQAGVTRVILEIDTYGGYLDPAIRIKERILASPVPTSSFVTRKAISAGALITLAGEKIFMAPGTTIGAAEPRVGEEKADEKVVSMWTQELRGTAEAYGRDGNIAAAMADADIEIPGLVKKGKLLTLTQKQAVDLKFADFLAVDRKEVLQLSDLAGARIVETRPSSAEALARWVTSPYVSPVLLTLGIAGLILEVLTVGWGIAGTVGLISMALYFGGHIMAGLTGWGAVLLFMAGIVLLLIEAFIVPGFGFAGIGGLAALVVSIIIASASVEQAIMSLVIALLGTTVILAASFRFVKTRRMWNRLILGVRQENSAGYVAPEKNLSQFLGAEGFTITPLRPAGAVEINGARVDVVSEGGFIPGQTRVKVVKVEGTRVVVRQSNEG